jgi:G3E family GTPase
MRLLLVTGFLGSGKTTLILSLARTATEAGQRVAVVVNEVGEVGIDGSVFRLGDLEVTEITAGCICCQIGVDLVLTLRALAEGFRPHLVIVEASGIATPAGVLETLDRYPVEAVTATLTLTVVDATRFEALHEVLTPLIEAQIAGADVIAVTKHDQAAPAEVETAVRLVGALAPGVPVHVVDATAAGSLSELTSALIGDAPGKAPATGRTQ